MIDSECGGQTSLNTDGYLSGSPELIVEVTESEHSIELGAKMQAYARNGVREYLVYRTRDAALDWFALRYDTYVPLIADDMGVIQSEVFPGLWLDVQAALRRDTAGIIAVLQQGLNSPEHARFVADLQDRRTS